MSNSTVCIFDINVYDLDPRVPRVPRTIFIFKELQIRLEEAEANALRGGKKLIEKLEAKIRGLTTDLDCEHRWKTEYMKNFRKAERRLKEIEFQLEEERKNYEKLQVGDQGLP